MPTSPPPPLTALGHVDEQLTRAGWAVLDAATLGRLAETAPADWLRWQPLWNELPLDQYLKDGGRYRRRRHGSFVVDAGRVMAVPHRAHWQPLDYNALHGGLERWFEPLPAALVGDPAWERLLLALAGRADVLRGTRRWYLEAHTFRIDTEGGIGRPTPEGAHRDGVDLVAVVLVARQQVKGGETRVFDARGPQGVRFTLLEPFSALVLDDERVIHESTPLQPLQEGVPGFRDTLVVTLRGGGFQDPEAVRAPTASR